MGPSELFCRLAEPRGGSYILLPVLPVAELPTPENLRLLWSQVSLNHLCSKVNVQVSPLEIPRELSLGCDGSLGAGRALLHG